jgi:hypothetical protein
MSDLGSENHDAYLAQDGITFVISPDCETRENDDLSCQIERVRLWSRRERGLRVEAGIRTCGNCDHFLAQIQQIILSNECSVRLYISRPALLKVSERSDQTRTCAGGSSMLNPYHGLQ